MSIKPFMVVWCSLRWTMSSHVGGSSPGSTNLSQQVCIVSQAQWKEEEHRGICYCTISQFGQGCDMWHFVRNFGFGHLPKRPKSSRIQDSNPPTQRGVQTFRQRDRSQYMHQLPQTNGVHVLIGITARRLLRSPSGKLHFACRAYITWFQLKSDLNHFGAWRYSHKLISNSKWIQVGIQVTQVSKSQVLSAQAFKLQAWNWRGMFNHSVRYYS